MPIRKQPVFDLDAEEKKLAASYERGEWKSVKNLKNEVKNVRKIAENYISKNARINIRISASDLEQIKRIAAYEGLPYQTLIASILHKYAAGHLNHQSR